MYSTDDHTTVFRSGRKSFGQLIKQVYRHRSFIIVFAKRDIKVQYTQTILGILWSFIQALTAILIINFFFGILLNIKTGNIPYPLFAFPGMISWYYFSYLVSQAGTSLVQSQQLISKVFFPKLVLPLSKAVTGLIEFGIWFLLFIVLLIYYQYPITTNVLFLPIAVLLNIITGLSVGIWLSALTIRFRDAFHIIPYLIGFGVFVTPVFFETAMIPQQYHFLLYFNPMAGVIAFLRWCLLDMDFPVHQYCAGIIPVLIVFFLGLNYFRRVESKIADLL